MAEMTAQLTELLRRWSEAELKGDVATLGALISDDFAGIGPHGFQIDKGQWLQRYESGNLVNEHFEISDPAARSYGPVAVINGVQHQTAAYQGNPFPGRFRMTLVAVQSGSDWQIVNIQLSPMADQ
jgi:hypothetical protein